jgi:hypothetical protein
MLVVDIIVLQISEVLTNLKSSSTLDDMQQYRRTLTQITPQQ